MIEKICKNCSYFYKKNNKCRKSPPVILQVVGIDVSDFPATNEEDWCGEFNLREEANNASALSLVSIKKEGESWNPWEAIEPEEEK